KQVRQSASVVRSVTVKNLQGGEATLSLPPTAKLSKRRLAQRANDLGLQLYKEKRYTEAADKFSEALELRPNFALAANNLGFLYFRQGQYAQAVRWLENTLKIDPSRAVAQLNLGDVYLQLNNKDKARKAYTAYLDLQPQGSGAKQVRMKLTKL
ncbi:MAG TPA: tetratricopeptide repeat protein, partial [Xylella taiwanensis]